MAHVISNVTGQTKRQEYRQFRVSAPISIPVSFCIFQLPAELTHICMCYLQAQLYNEDFVS